MKREEVIEAVKRVLDQGTAGMDNRTLRTTLLELGEEIDERAMKVLYDIPDDEVLPYDRDAEEIAPQQYG
jgi:hypothetical protein